MEEARGQIKIEFNKVLNKIDTQMPGAFSITEYENFKDRYYEEELEAFWQEFELTTNIRNIQDKGIKKIDMAKNFAEIYIIQSRILQEKLKERQKTNEKILNLKSAMKSDQNNWKRQFFKEDSEFFIEIMELQMHYHKTQDTNYKIKLMFENSIQLSKNLKEKNRINYKFRFKVRNDTSVLYLQLLHFGVIGRGKYPIIKLKDQREKKIQIPLYNDTDDKIGDLWLKLRWIHSVGALIQEGYDKEIENIEIINQDLKLTKMKINCLQEICPHIKNYQGISLQNSNGNQFLHTIMILTLAIMNVIISLTYAHQAELICMLLIFLITQQGYQNKYSLYIIIIVSILCFKDLLNFFIFHKTDYSIVSQKLDMGSILHTINTYLLIPNFIIKLTYIILLSMRLL